MSSELAQRVEHETSRSSTVDEKTGSVPTSTETPIEREYHHPPLCAHHNSLWPALLLFCPNKYIATDVLQNRKPDHLELNSTTLEDGSSAATTDSSKKNQSLLPVPSRSSSRKVQPSPTSTGHLSGVTASDPSGSIGGGSRDSNTSIGKKRNGSVNSSKKSATQPATSGRKEDAVDATSPQSAQMPKPKKSRGFLSFLNCCGVPDNANGVDSEEAALPVKPISAESQSTRATTASKPVVSSPEVKGSRKVTECEKPVMAARDEPAETNQKTAGEGKVVAEAGVAEKHIATPVAQVDDLSAVTNDQLLPAIPNNAENSTGNPEAHLKTNPTVFVEAPTPNPVDHDDNNNGTHALRQAATAGDELADPTLITSYPTQEASMAETAEAPKANSALPPPPPLPMADVNAKSSVCPPEAALAEEIEEKQQWLLPPITDRFKGKKCLVLDLDETLVHSSFKVHNENFKDSVSTH